MKTSVAFALALLSLSQVSIADESCQLKIGMPVEYEIQSEDGALAAKDSSKFKLSYWEDNKQKVVKDASIKIIKIKKFHEAKKTGRNGTGQSWVSKVTDYAVRVQVTTKTTEIYGRMLGNQAVKDMTFSTLCTSIKTIQE